MITPIEMYSMVPKSQEASIVRNGENVRQVAQQQGGLQSVEQQQRQNTQQTVKTMEATNPEYRYDAKEQGNNQYSQNGGKKKKKQDEEERKEASSQNHSGFDVRI